MTPEKIKELVLLQQEILSVVQQYVKPGGRLIYSTCTISRQENEGNAQWFAKNHTDFQLLADRQILPQAEGGDGFYIAEFKKAPDIRSMTHQQLSAFLDSLGEKPYREKQVFSWLHQKCAADFDEMTDLSRELRDKLKQTARLTVLKTAEMQESRQDGTRKYLFALPDGNMVESVLMRYRHGNAVCISSQAGCRMACRFCASAIGGLVRNLEPSEMLEQVYRIHMDIGERISNVVVMGTGEPLDNYENLLRFIELLSAKDGMQISQRSLTVSTCGIVPKIYALAEKKLQITLALSLHAPTQEKRLSLMPVAAQYELSEVIKACDRYFKKTGRRMTYEYSLMHDVNDTPEDAAQLSRLLAGKNCHVNLIPVNPVRERHFVQPDENTTLAFKNKLEKNKINVTIRRELGRDIDGACGQLRKKYQAKQAETV
ncbi:MAG: 23S rRNA (adenine(2503)-C(2))-methyltransferase RlmN [Eubacterium sp.]|nr:23S rRNA (adenine(2503)-C(2))-methyltransferase RlmN [Eubacterium sp.]